MSVSGQPAGIRLLLVEDNPGDARLLRELLRTADSADGVEVKEAGRLDAALELLAREHFDVVLLDLSLPDSQGMGTVESALSHAPETPIIVLTGLDDQTVALRAVQAGAQDFLVKGEIDGRLLVRAVRYAQERKRLESERRRSLEREQEARAAAEAAVRARDEVLGIVSHDLGNSLSAIGVHARLLTRCGPDDLAEVVKRTATIQQLVGQMHRLRQDLLDAVSIEAGRLAIHPVAQPLRPILDEALDTLGEVASEKELQLRTCVPDPVPDVVVDRQRLLQVFANLLGNAGKFTPPGGSVTIRVEIGEVHARVSVEDTGPGLAPEDSPRVFESFWRKKRDEHGGAGLGLAIARGIVEAHGGEIWVESEPGEGAAFRFTVPLA
jgi:signal transduction histidine kinase